MNLVNSVMIPIKGTCVSQNDEDAAHEVSLEDYSDCLKPGNSHSKHLHNAYPGFLRGLDVAEDRITIPIASSFEEWDASCKQGEARAKQLQAETKQLQEESAQREKILKSKTQEFNKMKSEELKNVYTRALAAEMKEFQQSLVLTEIRGDLERATFRLEQANAKITSLQSALEAANAKIHTLQQSQAQYTSSSQNRATPSRVMEESKDHTLPNRESSDSFVRRWVPGMMIGFFRLKEPSRASQHPSHSVSVQSLSSSDEEDQQSTEDASLSSCGPAPPSVSWGWWIVSWIQAAWQALARGFRICFCKH